MLREAIFVLLEGTSEKIHIALVGSLLHREHLGVVLGARLNRSLLGGHIGRCNLDRLEQEDAIRGQVTAGKMYVLHRLSP
jgi:hypothetical protein